MGNPNAERRLAAASAACDAARAEYEKAVSQAVARPKSAAGWRELQERAVEAAVALGVAQAELNAAKRDAGLLAAPARPAGGKVLVALVRVPDRAAAALLHGPGDLGVWIAEAVALQYASDFDADAGAPGNPWAVEVRARFGADAADADAFTAEAVGFLPADGEEAHAVAAILAGRAVCFPDADGMRGEAGRPSHNGNDGGGRRLGGFEKGFCMAPDFDAPLAEDADGREAKGGVDD